MDTPYISTAQAAQALGVSVSTVKRWVDEGILPADRTAGGHRKLRRAEVLAMARRGELPQQDLGQLELATPRRRKLDAGSAAKALLDDVLRGDAAAVRSVIRGVYAAGGPLESLADEVVAPVLQQLGHDWEAQRIGVWHEHRGTELCTAALHELLADLQTRSERGRPIAVGGAPEGDPYQAASLLAQLVLLDAGWNAVNLGPNTPLDGLAAAMHELRPRLVWLSASHLDDAERFVAEYKKFYREAEKAGVAVAVGGRALTEAIRGKMPYTTFGDGLTHLAAFARSLHPRPKRPPRGRPRSK